MPGIMWKVKSNDDDDDADDNDNDDDDPCPGMWLMLQQDKPDDFVLATGHMHSVREFVEVIIVIALTVMIIIFILTIIILIRITLHQVLNLLHLIINIHQAACEYIGMELEWEGSGDSEIAKEKKTGIVRLFHHCLTIVKLKILENRRLSLDSKFK